MQRRGTATVVKASCVAPGLRHHKDKRQVFSLLSRHVPQCRLLSTHTQTHIDFFGWMHFIAYIAEKYTSISPDCCCLLGSYHAIVTVTLVELMDLIEACLPSPRRCSYA